MHVCKLFYTDTHNRNDSSYGQSLFEGLKAFRREDGTIVMFRPDMNARRMASGASRFLLPAVGLETFVTAAEEVVR